MCGISGVYNLHNKPQKGLSKYIQAMNYLQEHRGPDGEGAWFNDNKSVGFGHRRLSIIDLEDRAAQPMRRGIIFQLPIMVKYIIIKSLKRNTLQNFPLQQIPIPK